VAHAEAEVQHYEQVIAAGKATVTNAAAGLDVEKKALAAVVKVCSEQRSAEAVFVLLQLTSSLNHAQAGRPKFPVTFMCIDIAWTCLLVVTNCVRGIMLSCSTGSFPMHCVPRAALPVGLPSQRPTCHCVDGCR
jgi:hypothetical protein